MLNPDFFNDRKKAQSLIDQCNNNKDLLSQLDELSNHFEQINTLIQSLSKDEEDMMVELIQQEYQQLLSKYEDFEIKILLSHPYDRNNAIIELHPGAGGTESQDWAAMLQRMYLRYCSLKGFKVEILDYLEGEEAGLKSCSMLVSGPLAYGFLKSEKGVHRLVRISPFDSGGRRHTSFAAVLVTPLFNNNIDINIQESDIRIDVYRSSGCGGQGVNTTDSAVRITHLPTKIVVTCQNERSQIQNKEKALEVLKNKLYQKELEEQKNKLNSINGEISDINFGSQIRTYTMCPYTLVKDHRTSTEDNNVFKVLDGDIDKFINDSLKAGSINEKK